MKFKAVLATLFLCAASLAAFAGAQQTVNDLLPRLAAAQVEDRYAAQMELQALALNATRPGAEAERAELAALLAAKATDPAVPQPARVWVVRQLEYIGAAESVAALTTLLNGPDAELKECARRALEKNPAPAATEALQAALKQGAESAWRIGLIQSLGERRDSAAVELIKPRLADKETAFAAASALGKIDDPNAVAALWEAYGRGITGAADGLVIAGNRLLSAGDKAAAGDLFKQLYLAGAPQPGATPQATGHPPASVQVRSAALLGWAAADPDSVRPIISEALQQSQPELQAAAVTAATVVYGKPGISATLAPLLPKLSPSAKVYVLRVLDASAEQQVLAAAGDPEESVQLAALERLGQIGTAASVPLLLKTAGAGSSAAQKVAMTALERMPDPGAGADIARLAAGGEPAARALAINVLAGRSDYSAAPALLKYAAESDPEVSAAACAALARIGTDHELEGLIQLVLAGKTPCATAALQAVASRATDKTAAAQKLIAQAKTAVPGQLAPIYDILALLGGSEALITVSTAAASSNAEVKDAAVRALANWPDFTATKPLLVIATDPHTTRVHNALAIQGVARLVKTAETEPAADRLKTAQAAMNAATREEDKKLMLSAIASVNDRAAGEMLKPFLSVSQYQKEAGLAALTLAESLRKTDRPAAMDLAQAVKQAGISDDLTRKAEAVLKRK
jgi:hypothetical protein